MAYLINTIHRQVPLLEGNFVVDINNLSVMMQSFFLTLLTFIGTIVHETNLNYPLTDIRNEESCLK